MLMNVYDMTKEILTLKNTVVCSLFTIHVMLQFRPDYSFRIACSVRAVICKTQLFRICAKPVCLVRKVKSGASKVSCTCLSLHGSLYALQGG